MTWWRRDPMLSPIHRYAQRFLPSQEAALRTRCFSRTPSKSAQHEDDSGTKRPSGLSNLDWLQLQHYQRWRKRLMEDPYQAIFGASNDMLSGKGLKDWDWISKSFPKWILREMEGHEELGTRPGNDKRKTLESNDPKRVGITSEGSSPVKQREPRFPQLSYRATRLDREDSSGIASPSDLRRPQEQTHFKVVGYCSDVEAAPRTDTVTSIPPSSAPPSVQTPATIPPKSIESFHDYVVETLSKAAAEIEPSKTPFARDTAFIQHFLADKPQHEKLLTENEPKINTWRHTELQRRSSHELMTENNESAPAVRTDEEASITVASTQEIPAPPIQLTNEHSPVEISHTQQTSTTQDRAASVRSTSKILSQLPKDDIDFLSASDIRASMASKRVKILGSRQREAERLNLEKTFADAHKANERIDPMLESKIINDQHIRRVERQMREPSNPVESTEESQPVQQSLKSTSSEEGVLDSSIDRMTKWLHQGGAVFSSHFWQDPTEDDDAKKTRLFFDKVITRMRRGHVTMQAVVQDLESDLPASKPLCKRFREDEALVSSAIIALRQRSQSGVPQPSVSRKLRSIQTLRLKFQDTERELEAAYTALREIGKADAARSVKPAVKRNLVIASKIIQKYGQLTRTLIWSIQARLEDPNIDPSILADYKIVANSLLTLRDTQMALGRMVDRAMLVYGVVPNVVEDSERSGRKCTMGFPEGLHRQLHPKPEVSHILSEVDKAQLRAKVAADERLANEVDAQKFAMRGLADDGYAQAPKSVLRKSLEEYGPLAHSLFRPFGSVLESMGRKETPAGIEAAKAKEDATKRCGDAILVAEVRKAYEDTHGPITVRHKQPVDAAEKVKKEQETDVKRFDMLKEDPVSGPLNDLTSSTSGETAIKITENFAVHTKSTEHSAPVELKTPLGTRQTAPTTKAAAVDDAQGAVQHSPVATEATPSTGSTTIPEASIAKPSSDTALSHSSIANLPTQYTILIHDPQTDKLSLTISISGPPRDTSPVLPLHQALSDLDNPAKFIPYITKGLEVVSAKKDMLVLRNALDDASSTFAFQTLDTPPNSHVNECENVTERVTVNPIDGTTRLSPTGYVGPEESREQLEKEFDERREAAGKLSSKEQERYEQSPEKDKSRIKGRKRVGAGSVVKTAIWAAAVCYVVGVVGEIANAPF
ncbi:hypothetical protein EJ02DRAFT_506827 [Clathrospora elynae]|uniref:Uncharacterized protein n=1 Tax=Clathrospora elynae TaxID=706981 RepID=A0A6A5S8C8_9PLEO|nr:hypothetical protein EJ02DRAFT_506827 [Clathrospora elynae]